jgi:GNAT superfamily N-acetyltransferase
MAPPAGDPTPPDGHATPDVVVRPAAATDVTRVVALLRHGALDDGAEDPDDSDGYGAAPAEIAGTPGCEVPVVEVDGEVVSVCQVIVFRHLQHRGGRCGELESIHVDPDHRGRGIGTVLVTAAVDPARAAGCYRVQLTSDRRRPDAHRFYERAGFTPSHVGFKRLLDGDLRDPSATGRRQATSRPVSDRSSDRSSAPPSAASAASAANRAAGAGGTTPTSQS